MARISKYRRTIVSLIATAALVAAFPGVGAASHVDHSWINPGDFPDGCDIKGFVDWHFNTDTAFARTTEEHDCARLEAKIRRRDSNYIWRTTATGYLFSSEVSTGWQSANLVDYADHNGDNNGSGTAYGIRHWI